jgi:hypothetical protein
MVRLDYNGHSHLCTMVKHILPQVCLTLWCEQNWSSYSFVHNKMRNCFKFDQAINPMYIYTNSKLLKERLGATPISWYEKNMLHDVPPNSSRDPKMGPGTKQRKKKKNWCTFPNLHHFEGKKAC